MRLTCLWSTLTSYMVASLRALADYAEVEIQVVYSPQDENAPYSDFDLSFAREVINRVNCDKKQLLSNVQKFQPDLVLMSGWNFSVYRTIAKTVRRGGARVIAGLDNACFKILSLAGHR